jgi:UDP-glucuronate decarboxylase
MKILVTGAAGFLGSNLSQKLLNEGHKVVAVDNMITGNKKNIKKLQRNKNFKFIKHDVIKYKSFNVDGIFNLACPASPPLYQKNPIHTVKTNVIGASNLLELASKKKIRILQASTSEIYGDPKLSPQTEEYWGNVNPVGVRSCYDEGKRTAETLFMDFHRQNGVDIRIARIFNTYGPNMHINDGRVVSNFIVQAITNQNITIYGDGNQIRSFCFVDDLIDGLTSLFFKEDLFNPINLGNPEPISMNNLASEIIKLTNSKSQITYMKLPNDDPVNRIPDISKAKLLLNWNPLVDRESGLLKTIEYFSNEIKAQ